MSEATPQLSAPSTAARRPAWWMLALVALLAFGVYANSLKNGYAFDDVAIVEGNRHVVNLEWTAIWYDNYWPKSEGIQPDILYRPITLWTYLANEAIFPRAPWAFHLVNVLLHAMVSVLLTVLAWRIVGDRRVATVTGILFAVHPIHTEVVANIVGRAELLAALWSLLALLVFLPRGPITNEAAPRISGRLPLLQLATVTLAAIAGVIIGGRPTSLVTLIQPHPIYGAAIGMAVGLLLAAVLHALLAKRAPADEGLRPWWHGILVALCFLTAMLCKETPATLVFAILLIDGWRWFRWSDRRPTFLTWFSVRCVRYYVPVAVAVGLYFFLRLGTGALMADSRVTHRIVNPLVDASIAERIVTPFMLLAKYLWMNFWPVQLSADYSAPSLMPTTKLFYATAMQPPAIAGVLAIALLILLAVTTWRRHPQMLLIVGLFFTGYMLVANVLRIGTIFGERLFYWPGAFILMLLAWGGVLFYTHTRSQLKTARGLFVLRTLSLGAVAVATLLMGARTWARNPDWADNISLAISTARDNPESGKACSWAGSVLITSKDPAIADFGRTMIERAIELTPDYASARWELAKFYGVRAQLAKSVIYLTQAAEVDPGKHQTRAAMIAVLQDLRLENPALYMPILEEHLSDHPDQPSAYLAMALGQHAQQQWDEAEANAHKALDLRRSQNGDGFEQYHEAGAELASIQFDRGNVEAAIDTFRKYLAWMRGSVDGRCTFARMLMARDLTAHPTALDEAAFHLSIVDFIEPNNPNARLARGELYRIWSDLPAHLNASVTVSPDPGAARDLSPFTLPPEIGVRP